MKKSTKVILSVVIAAVIAVIFIYPRKDSIFGKKQENTNAGPAAGPGGALAPLPVNVVELRPERLENNLSITGTIIPNETVNLRPEIPGLVTRVAFREGEFVKKGTPLVYLNDDELKAQYDRLNYSKKLFESQENRQKQLLEKEAISQEEYDIVLNQFNTNLADLRLVEAQLNKTVIRAPFDGVVGLRQISEGSVIGTADVIASIVNIDPIKIEFSIPERYANEVKIGSKIFFANDAGGADMEGTVYAYEPSIETGTRTLRIRATSPNKDRRFLPGMFVRIRYILGVNEGALMVPSEAILPELSGYKVYIVNNKGKVEERQVTIGTRTDRYVQLVDGVTNGDLVLTTGILQVRGGMPVNYTKIN
ncbi:efflux RND transporter periplasmic adaptor subunit [Mongoliitalea lutea]|uniref:MexH family multidrug efflux RND transporter periplasmic adaptor subunit n=1 Tax=Mongoliitalea lutea TaxID=849756 RepID=A0A8J3G4K9_9BACT|nr:efflux RND transporter periplasmic adaptor subunit [Mongoliitalea lutea]GHB29882.1 MexH family multidrug efflux RND transporter periplasmic adaptor subunit [Mongoliitalea lutea]